MAIDTSPRVGLPIKPRMLLDLESGEIHEVETVVAEEHEESVFVAKGKRVGIIKNISWTRQMEPHHLIEDTLVLEVVFVSLSKPQ